MATSNKSDKTSTTRQTGAKRQASATSKAKSNSSSKPAAKNPAAKKSTAAKKAPPPRLDDGQRSLLAGIVILFLTAILTLSLLSPNQGQFTQWLSGLAGLAFGIGRVVIPLITGGIGVFLVLRGMEQEPELPWFRLLGAAVVFLVFLAFASMIAYQREQAYESLYAVAAAGKGGGYLGSLLATALARLLGDLGTIATLMVVGLAGVVLAAGLSRDQVAGWFEREPRPSTGAEPAERTVRINPGREAAANAIPVARPPTADRRPEPQLRLIPEEGEAPARGAAVSVHEKPKRGKKETPPPVFIEADRPAAAVVPGSIWTLPRVSDVLESGTDIDVNSASIRERVEVIEQTLESFGAPATVVEINQGPTITQFGVEPNYVVMRGGKRTKVKVGKIAGLADDLALALAARSIRIQAPVPGKGYVGIEVPNSAKALVSLRDVMESAEYGRMKSPLRVGLGQNVAGQPIAADLTAMPHVLIAGTTGSGKSVCVNGIIACLLLQNTPDDLRLVMVDPKRVELTGYNGIPHLAAPVVVDMDRVIGTLQWALREMDNRYKLFAGAGARNLVEYNKKIRRDATVQKLPYIVIVIDELADLMMLAPEDTERSITRLAQMARATGIHMVIATQRPSVDVVTGLIKANFPARIAFAVASSTDSRVILDATGAERLLGQGDMLFQSPDAAAPVRLQGCFVSDGELARLISYWQTARRAQVIAAPGATAGAAPVERPATDDGRRTSTDHGPQTMPTQARPVKEPVVIIDPQPGPPAYVPPPISHLNAPVTDTTTPAPQRRAPKIPMGPPDEVRSTNDERTSAHRKPVMDDEVTDLEEDADEVIASGVGRATGVASAGGHLDDVLQQPLWEALQQMENDNGNVAEGDDELLPEAIALVRSLNKASTSLLQRRFRIGYTRAARLMDALEDQGIIGPPTGTSKAREVYGGDGMMSDEG
ncbi:MAG TPA: DNA translocase FtsK 4TM domain-containing protein [Promineifilum sp.]|nr:DNA translocase FtsK 4TM domain-containing protein [Promineifilum sp.]HRQ11793.1 DNA translocase FtsK 4TM domain-containing protein [Promineifilum sp.]